MLFNNMSPADVMTAVFENRQPWEALAIMAAKNDNTKSGEKYRDMVGR
jgi:hypothetical protein